MEIFSLANILYPTKNQKKHPVKTNKFNLPWFLVEILFPQPNFMCHDFWVENFPIKKHPPNPLIIESFLPGRRDPVPRPTSRRFWERLLVWRIGTHFDGEGHLGNSLPETSKWVFPKIMVPRNDPFVHRVFHYKPSILVYHYFLETPKYLLRWTVFGWYVFLGSSHTKPQKLAKCPWHPVIHCEYAYKVGPYQL